MTARGVASTLLIGAACSTGLVACGGSDKQKVSDAVFLDHCQSAFNKNASPAQKAYGAAFCKCGQAKLEAQGLGNKDIHDKVLAGPTAAAGKACAQEISSGK
jgi:hypothetical protein